MKVSRILALPMMFVMALGIAGAQQWAPLNHPLNIGAGTMLQLRDGRILVHNADAVDWYILTPDSTGSYVNGSWTGPYNLPSSYGPLYYGSQVLLDGRHVVIEGGEYNFGAAVWQTQGAVGTVTPFGGVSWVLNNPPAGWGTIGDAESIILPNGNYMQSNCCTAQNAIYNGPNSWIATGSVLQPSNDESGFTILTNNKILTVDAKFNSNCGTNVGSELYDQSSGTWSCAGHLPAQLYNANDEELGAAVLMYNNKVFQMGGNVVASAVYDVASNTWTAGPTPPNSLNQADGPAALEPNGKVLTLLSPGLFQFGACQFMEYNPTSNTLANAPNPAACPGDSSYDGHLMILPTGQIMFTNFGGNPAEVYTPASGVVSGVAATILVPSTNLVSGSTNNLLYGYQLNGLTQNNAYGDDYQGDTNYPLVRLTSVADGSVHYAFTHDDSTHSIAPHTFGFTHFDLPTLTPGQYNLVSVTNGIASNSIRVTVH